MLVKEWSKFKIEQHLLIS